MFPDNHTMCNLESHVKQRHKRKIQQLLRRAAGIQELQQLPPPSYGSKFEILASAALERLAFAFPRLVIHGKFEGHLFDEL